MNRRDFTKSLGALLAAPVLPLKALAAPATAAASSAIAPPNLYTWSAALARTQGQVSSEMLMAKLNVDANQAASLFNKLISNKVVGPANAIGLSHANAIRPAAPVLRTPDCISSRVEPDFGSRTDEGSLQTEGDRDEMRLGAEPSDIIDETSAPPRDV